MAKPRVATEKPKRKSIFHKYHFPVGAIYNGKTEGGSESGGSADIQLCKCMKNVWINLQKRRTEESIKEYAIAEWERVYGDSPPNSRN